MGKKKHRKKNSVSATIWKKLLQSPTFVFFACALLTAIFLYDWSTIPVYRALKDNNTISQEHVCISYDVEVAGRSSGRTRYNLTLENGDVVSLLGTVADQSLSLQNVADLDFLLNRTLTYEFIPSHDLLFSGAYVLVSISDGAHTILPGEAVIKEYQSRLADLPLALVIGCSPILILELVIRGIGRWVDFRVKQIEHNRKHTGKTGKTGKTGDGSLS